MPIFIPSPYDYNVYTKSEIDDFINNLKAIKADKAPDTIPNCIALLRGTDGNLVNSQVLISDLLFGDFADGGEF